MTRRIAQIISTHAGGFESVLLVGYVLVMVIIVVGRNVRLVILFLPHADGLFLQFEFLVP